MEKRHDQQSPVFGRQSVRTFDVLCIPQYDIGKINQGLLITHPLSLSDFDELMGPDIKVNTTDRAVSYIPDIQLLVSLSYRLCVKQGLYRLAAPFEFPDRVPWTICPSP